jgi:mobilome CxxCx(11)CxxC protein
MNDRVTQVRTDALVAEYIYTVKLNRISILTNCITSLTILVPILLTSALLIAKGSEFEYQLNILSIIISAILLSLSVFSLIYRVEQKKENYIIGRRSNIYVSNEALKLIDQNDSELTWFYNYLVEMDSKDQENIGNVSNSLQKEAYRHSLKKLLPGNEEVVCRICKATPFMYKKGSCQVCGNTPKE